MKSTFTAVVTAVIATFLFSASAYSYPIPDMEDAKLTLEETQLIADTEPRTEITIRTFVRPDGMKFRQYSVGGNVFRYDMDEDGTGPYEYRLLDTDGDGTFETKEMLVGTTDDDGQKYFIDLGSEPGKEYRYSYEDSEKLKEREREDQRIQRRVLEGYSIYIPTWVVVKFK